MAIVIVSTHFDDAVFSCWTLIAGEGDVDVLTVFTAGPAAGLVTDWDRDTGVDSATRMVQRAAENDAALALAGRRATNVGLLEAQYDDGGVNPEALRSYLEGAESVYIPAGIAVNRPPNGEHCIVRDACLQIRPDANFYADNPYCYFREDVHLLPGVPSALTPRVVELTAEQRSLKAEAISCYVGELAKLESIFGPCTNPERLAYEVFWTRD